MSKQGKKLEKIYDLLNTETTCHQKKKNKLKPPPKKNPK